MIVPAPITTLAPMATDAPSSTPSTGAATCGGLPASISDAIKPMALAKPSRGEGQARPAQSRGNRPRSTSVVTTTAPDNLANVSAPGSSFMKQRSPSTASESGAASRATTPAVPCKLAPAASAMVPASCGVTVKKPRSMAMPYSWLIRAGGSIVTSRRAFLVRSSRRRSTSSEMFRDGTKISAESRTRTRSSRLSPATSVTISSAI